MVAKIDGAPVKLEPKDYPGLLLTFEYKDLPGILQRRPMTEDFHGILTWHHLPGFSQKIGRLARAYPIIESVSLGNQGDGRELARMLAKIAHAYSVAELGLSSFKPFLTNIILNRPPMYVGHYVGGLRHDEKGKDLHHIEISTFWPDQYIVVEIRLFADRTLPLYVVVVGERN
jgi:hypothetical protein